jgi:hypothetical protein
MIVPSPRGRDVFVFVGDSITAPPFVWYADYQTAVLARYTDLFSSVAQAPYTPGTFASQGMVYDYRIGAIPAFFNSGVSGNQVMDIDNNWAARIGAYGPTILVIHIGINDVVTFKTPPETYQARLESIVDKTKVAYPMCQVVLTTLWMHFEDWPSGANVDDATIEDYCARIRSVAAAKGCELVDFRATVYSQLEPAYNPDHKAFGILVDNFGLHPLPMGKLLLSKQVLMQTQMP